MSAISTAEPITYRLLQMTNVAGVPASVLERAEREVQMDPALLVRVQAGGDELPDLPQHEGRSQKDRRVDRVVEREEKAVADAEAGEARIDGIAQALVLRCVRQEIGRARELWLRRPRRTNCKG